MTPDRLIRMKPQNLVTGLPIKPSGGGRMSVVTPIATIAVGVVVERSKGASLWSDFLWRPVSVLTGVPETPPWTQAVAMTASARLFMPARRRSSFIVRKPRIYRDNLMIEEPLLWVVLRSGGGRSAVRAAEGDRRSGRGRGLGRHRGRHRRDRADAGDGARHRCGLRVRAPCRSRLQQAPARPRRSRGARPAAADASEKSKP